MGCGNPKKDIENQMMIIKLERVKLQMERINNLKLLEEIDGIKKTGFLPVPDYIEPISKEKNNNLNMSQTTHLIKGGMDVNTIKGRDNRIKNTKKRGGNRKKKKKTGRK